MQIPSPESLDQYIPALAHMVAKTTWLPNPAVVASLGGAVFPTSRVKNGHPRFSEIRENGSIIGMYDDNATPEWAIFWAHGLSGSRPKGWTIAHVWPTSDDINSYTCLANLAMVREPFASLTDKNGPLTGFLRWHAWDIYKWKPAREPEPKKPGGYDTKWRYLHGVDDPWGSIRQRLAGVDNERARILRPIMEKRGIL